VMVFLQINGHSSPPQERMQAHLSTI
jgi:hypothetical protein